VALVNGGGKMVSGRGVIVTVIGGTGDIVRVETMVVVTILSEDSWQPQVIAMETRKMQVQALNATFFILSTYKHSARIIIPYKSANHQVYDTPTTLRPIS
jgi:hypothetical protein